ncbi:aquaporin [Promicromonospora sp. NPDC057138]|uniref:aquaporin n=1 Tax=Promicromonospora sp. NPDC057138 TaxID=3346031 RepID=UPI00363AC572
MWRRALGELLGTGLLVAVVVGSGIAATKLSPDDAGLQLLENSTATALGLAVLIAVLGPLSGAHFNPVVTLVDWVLGRREPAGPRLGDAGAYIAAQVAGGIGGALLANAMFGEPAAVATTARASGATFLAEVVATAGLVLVILGLLRSGRGALVAPAVGAYIGAAYWFTSSTSFANPAVTVGRVFSDTFAGIAPGSVLPFVLAQLVGGALGLGLAMILYPPRPA